MIGIIGRGSFGKVKLAVDVKTGKNYAIKIIKKPSGFGSGRSHAQTEALKQEIGIMKKLRHKHIVSLIEVINDPEVKKIYLVLDYIDGGEIGAVSQADKTCAAIAPRLLATLAAQVCSGLRYLHGKNIIHRDIKPENILVNADKSHAYLADFGVSQFVSAGRKSVCGVTGTKLFLAPEIVNGGKSSNAFGVDMWAFGVTLWVLLTGKMPFEHQADYVGPDSTLPPLPEAHFLWAPLFKRMLDFDPCSRASAEEVVSLLRELEDSLEFAEDTAYEGTISMEVEEFTGVFTTAAVNDWRDQSLSTASIQSISILGGSTELNKSGTKSDSDPSEIGTPNLIFARRGRNPLAFQTTVVPSLLASLPLNSSAQGFMTSSSSARDESVAVTVLVPRPPSSQRTAESNENEESSEGS